MTCSSTFIGGFALASAIAMMGSCVEGARAEPKKPEAVKALKVTEPTPAASDIQRFCTNNAAIAGDSRIGWQTAKLHDLEAQIRQRLQELEAKKAEYVTWMRKRDEAMRQATESIVAIYARMRPESAALQLAAMEDVMAAAILAKLPSRGAGVILNEMEAGRAARLTRAMVGPDTATDGKKS